MTDLGAAPAAATAPLGALGPVGPARIPASPGARRLEQPRWRDGRLLAGVLLLLVSVVVGARVLAAGGTTTPVVALAADVPAGHVLVATDLTTAQVHLGDTAAAQYVGADQLPALTGRVMSRGARSGELLAVGALGSAAAATPARLVAVSVASGLLPGLSAGDRVDVYATGLLRPADAAPAPAPASPAPTQAAASPAAPQCTTQLIAANLEVGADVDAGAGSGATTVLLRVDPALAGTIVHAAETAQLDVTRHLPVGDAQGAAATAPVQGYDDLVTTSCGSR